MAEYSKEQLKELYEKLPKKMQDALYSEENGRNIKEICEKNSIKDNETLFGINKYVGFVLMGLLPPDKLASVFEKELKIEKAKSEEISSQIGHLVFYPVKDILEPLYGIKMVIKPIKKAPETKVKNYTENKEDSYREPVE